MVERYSKIFAQIVKENSKIVKDKRFYEILEPGFEISKLRYRRGNFSFLKWLYLHKNVSHSVPVLGRNTLILYKRLYNQAIRSYDKSIDYTRNFLDGMDALESLLDEKILKNLKNEKLNEIYFVGSPFMSELIFSLPPALLYKVIFNNQATWNFKYKYSFPLKFILFVGKPVRQVLSGWMHYGVPILLKVYYIAFKPFQLPNIDPFILYQILMLFFAVSSEVVGESFEPFIAIEPVRPMPVLLRHYSARKVLKKLPKQTFLMAPLLDVVPYDEVQIEILEEFLPQNLPSSELLTLPSSELLTLPSPKLLTLPSTVEIPLKKVLEIGTKEKRQKLRSRSQIRARKTRNAVVRIITF